MRRRTHEGAPDAGQAAQVTHEAAWWAARAQLDEPLTLDEFRRYDALTHERVDVDLAVRAVADAAMALASVSRSVLAAGPGALATAAEMEISGLVNPR